MTTSVIIGKGGRLGQVIANTLRIRGDHIADITQRMDNLIFAHRYRGPESYREEMQANVEAIANIIESSRINRNGSIVIVSSVIATAPTLTQPLSYNLSKAAQLQLSRYYAEKLRPLAIRVNSVSPDAFTGAAPKVTIQQVADVIAWLCSQQSSGVNGQDIKVTG